MNHAEAIKLLEKNDPTLIEFETKFMRGLGCLNNNTHLKSLKLGSNAAMFSSEPLSNFDDLLQGLNENKSIEKLVFQSLSLDGIHLRTLSGSIETMKALKWLDFVFCAFDTPEIKKGIKSLVHAILNNPNIQGLTLRFIQNNMHSSGAAKICKLLSSTKLESLWIADSELGDDTIDLFKALAKNTSVKSFYYYAGNPPRNNYWQTLIEMLEKNKFLESIESGCHVDTELLSLEEFERIYMAALNHPRLTALKLYDDHVLRNASAFYLKFTQDILEKMLELKKQGPVPEKTVQEHIQLIRDGYSKAKAPIPKVQASQNESRVSPNSFSPPEQTNPTLPQHMIDKLSLREVRLYNSLKKVDADNFEFITRHRNTFTYQISQGKFHDRGARINVQNSSDGYYSDIKDFVEALAVYCKVHSLQPYFNNIEPPYTPLKTNTGSKGPMLFQPAASKIAFVMPKGLNYIDFMDKYAYLSSSNIYLAKEGSGPILSLIDKKPPIPSPEVNKAISEFEQAMSLHKQYLESQHSTRENMIMK